MGVYLKRRENGTGHLHYHFQYDQPNIITMSAFREHPRRAPTEEITPSAVAEAIDRHMASTDSTVGDRQQIM